MSDQFKNYYKTLGIAKDATIQQIKKAYRELALKYHPDKNIDKKEWAEEQFKEISEAYETLIDLTTRAEYDVEYDYEVGISPTKPKTRRKSKGGLGAPTYTDYRGEARRAIRDALEFYHLWNPNEQLGQKYLDLFHHQCHRYENFYKADYFIHILFCLDTQSEVENFKNKVLQCISNYITELNIFKEEVIARIDKYFKDSGLDEDKICRKLWNERRQNGFDYKLGLVDWRDYIRLSEFFNTKEDVLGYEKIKMGTVDDWKRNRERDPYNPTPPNPRDDIPNPPREQDEAEQERILREQDRRRREEYERNRRRDNRYDESPNDSSGNQPPNRYPWMLLSVILFSVLFLSLFLIIKKTKKVNEHF